MEDIEIWVFIAEFKDLGLWNRVELDWNFGVIFSSIRLKAYKYSNNLNLVFQICEKDTDSSFKSLNYK